MNCPEPIARVVLELLHVAAVHIRSAAWAGDAQRCAVAAEHMHNLPHLLSNYSVDKLRYYWEGERTWFIRDSEESDLMWYRPYWDELSQHLPAEIRTDG
jgi:hypothetical protein